MVRSKRRGRGRHSRRRGKYRVEKGNDEVRNKEEREINKEENIREGLRLFDSVVSGNRMFDQK
jgi:hypothetical protein